MNKGCPWCWGWFTKSSERRTVMPRKSGQLSNGTSWTKNRRCSFLKFWVFVFVAVCMLRVFFFLFFCGFFVFLFRLLASIYILFFFCLLLFLWGCLKLSGYIILSHTEWYGICFIASVLFLVTFLVKWKYPFKDTVTLKFTFFLKNIFFQKYIVFVIYYKFSKQKI